MANASSTGETSYHYMGLRQPFVRLILFVSPSVSISISYDLPPLISPFLGSRLGSASNGVPAEAPYLQLSSILQPSGAFAADDTRNLGHIFEGWSKDSNANVALLSQFQNLTILWDLENVEGNYEHQTLVLQPGWLYTLRARVRFCHCSSCILLLLFVLSTHPISFPFLITR